MFNIFFNVLVDDHFRFWVDFTMLMCVVHISSKNILILNIKVGLRYQVESCEHFFEGGLKVKND